MGGVHTFCKSKCFFLFEQKGVKDFSLFRGI